MGRKKKYELALKGALLTFIQWKIIISNNHFALRRSENSLSVKLTYSTSEDHWFKKSLIQLIEYSTGRFTLEKKLNRILNSKHSEQNIWAEMIRELNLKLHIDCNKLEAIPTDGPLILIANHPYGVVDGIIMAHLASKIRPHFKAFVNEVLCRSEAINSCFLPIDFGQSKTALEINMASRKWAIDYLNTGGTIIIFPAGGVSTAPGLFKKAEDLQWKRFLIKMIKKTDATVVPIFFEGQNSHLFQLASQVHLNLRYGLLLNEVRNKMGRHINVLIGDPVQGEALEKLKRDELLNFLRKRVYALAD